VKKYMAMACAGLLCWSALPAAAAGLQDLQQFSDAFAQLAAQVKPAVVAIKTEKEVGQHGQQGDVPEFFREHPFFRMPEGQDGGVQEGLGSGVIVSKDGYILTNNHVITNGRRGDDGVADRIFVEMADLRSFPATVIGRDPNTDLAVLKIDEDDLPFLRFGNTDELDVGEWVMAIGNPFGQLHTVTTGIVSALGRGAGLTDYEDYIQTDAAINPGNSGGALANTAGELIGINTAIVSRSGGYQGIGFAIPIDLAAKIMQQLVAHGEVRRGFLGIGIEDVSAEMVEALGLDSRKGVLVTSVMEDLPAAAAGLETYDVIREVDGEPTDNRAALRNQIAHTPPGTEVQLKVLRDGKQRNFTVELASLDEVDLSTAPEEPKEAEKLGMSVQDFSAEMAERFGLDGESGVLVSRVQRGSVAARAGLRSRDLIVEINREPVQTVGDYEEAMEQAEGTALLMIRRVTRQGIRTDIIALRLPD
jgi:serine protease Do